MTRMTSAAGVTSPAMAATRPHESATPEARPAPDLLPSAKDDAATPVPHVGTSVRRVDGTRPVSLPGFQALLKPASPATAPRALTLPPPFRAAFEQQWDRTQQCRCETGFLIATGAQGEVLFANPSQGTASALNQDLRLPGDTALLGIFHTHPGNNGMFTSFSGRDTWEFLQGHHPAEWLQTGDGRQYLYLRTQETVRPPPDEADFLLRWRSSVSDLMWRFDLEEPEAIHLTNALRAGQYGVAYYEGRQGRFLRVDREALFEQAHQDRP